MTAYPWIGNLHNWCVGYFKWYLRGVSYVEKNWRREGGLWMTLWEERLIWGETFLEGGEGFDPKGDTMGCDKEDHEEKKIAFWFQRNTNTTIYLFLNNVGIDKRPFENLMTLVIISQMYLRYWFRGKKS